MKIRNVAYVCPAVLVLVLISCASHGLAQGPSSASPVKDFAKAELDKLKANATNPETLSPKTTINVLYESPQTIIMTANFVYLDNAGKVIDFAKQNGYHINSVTVFIEQQTGSTIGNPDSYTIFMSK